MVDGGPLWLTAAPKGGYCLARRKTALRKNPAGVSKQIAKQTG